MRGDRALEGPVHQANGSNSLTATAARNAGPHAERGVGGPVGGQNAEWISDMSFEG